MLLKAKVRECDVTGHEYETPVDGAHIFARGATGRVCWVMNAGPEAIKQYSEEDFCTIEELEKWAESEPGGYLDY